MEYAPLSFRKIELYMKKQSKTSVWLLLVICFSEVAAIDTNQEEQMCTEIGFKQKTEGHADCVLELITRKNKNRSAKLSATNSDGSSDDVTCQKFGFVVGSSGYSDCRLRMEIAKKEAQQKQSNYELELRRYEAQVAQYENEKERRQGEAMMRFGLSLMGGQSPYLSENLANASRASIGLPPVIPVAPTIQNFTITIPGGRMTNCSVISNNINCF